VTETPDLIGSWAAYQRLAGAGIGPASLEVLVAGAGAAAAPSRDTARLAATSPAEAAVVDVRTLLYRGERALKRAQELREASKQASGDTLRSLVEEVCDLVALALESNP
jgi:malic enzyme